MKNFNIIYFLFLSLFAVAQAPQKISYQGVARDNSGNILPNQSIGLRISLHSGSTSGPVVYQETHATSTNMFGLFNLEIGNGGVVSGTFNTISWGTNTYYIQVEMDATGGTSYSNMGTSQLVSVPYALYAEQAGNANTYTAGTGISISNNIITNTAPDTDDQTLSVSGNTLSINGGNSVTIPGYWTANGNHIYNNNSGNVGIGTTSPISKLMLEHSASSGDGRYMLRLNNTSTGSGSLAGIILDAGSSSDNDGNLFLEMLSETYTTVAGYEDFAQIRGSGGGLVLRASDAIGSGNSPVIRFQTQTIPPANGAYDRMIIDHDGNVGIGTTTPTNLLTLEVNSNSGESRNLLSINNTSTGDRSVAGIKLNAGSSQDDEKFMLLQFHSETYNLPGDYDDYGQVWSGGNGLILRAADYNGSPASIKFQTNLIPPANGSYDRMIITHEGNVGIGTTTPTTKLQLTDGDFYLDNSANGVIIKSPNGSCWKITVNDTGVLSTVSVTCP